MQSPREHFRIQTVAEATGVPAGTLRVWERRYGIPKPERGANGYRRYTQDDIRLVRRIVELGRRGHPPSEAARLVALEAQGAQSVELPSPSPPALDSETLRATIIDAIARLDEDRFDAGLQAALQLGRPWEVYDEVLGPVLRAVGERWRSGAITTGHEHFAAQRIGSLLRNLLRLAEPSPAAARGHLLLACVGGEQHDLPLYGVALHAVRLGWRTSILGVRTPPQALAAVVQSVAPDAVGLSLMVPLREGARSEVFAEYAAACAGVPWVVGGLAAAGYRAEIEAAGGTVLLGSAAGLESFLR